MKKIKSILILISVIYLVGSYNITKVYADENDCGNVICYKGKNQNGTPGYPGFDHSEKPGTSTGGTFIPGGGDLVCGEGIHAYCSVERGSIPWHNVSAHMYDIYGNEIDIFNYEQPFLAGTYVGLNIYEEIGYNSWATYEVEAYKITYMCSKIVVSDICTKPKYCGTPTSGGVYKCGCNEYWTYEDTYTTYEKACNEGYTIKGATVESATACSAAISNCSSKAQPDTFTISGSSYNITYNDSNDIDTDKETDYIYNTMQQTANKNCTDNDYEDDKKGKNTLTNSCEYTYNRGKVCINIKNGKVRYIDEEETCKETLPSSECDGMNNCNIEYELLPEYDSNGNFKYWKYFIPLNATSQQDFSLTMSEKTAEKKNKDFCYYIVDKYDDFNKRIKTVNEGTYALKNLKITSDMSELKKENIKKQAKNRINSYGGCYLETTITIPVVQKFYNELDNGINFKGFNFYYKPIDITDPFPNGLTNTSLWYDWNEDEEGRKGEEEMSSK